MPKFFSDPRVEESPGLHRRQQSVKASGQYTKQYYNISKHLKVLTHYVYPVGSVSIHTGRKVKRSKESRSVAFSKMLRNLNLLNTNTFPYFLINRLIFTDNPLFIYLLQQIERLIKRVVTILHDQMKFTLYFAITTMPDCLADNDR